MKAYLGLGLIAIYAIFAVGWILNIIKLITSVSDPITAMFILRCVGVLFAPLGGLLGWL